jgi:hypothetical protein
MIRNTLFLKLLAIACCCASAGCVEQKAALGIGLEAAELAGHVGQAANKALAKLRGRRALDVTIYGLAEFTSWSHNYRVRNMNY